VKNSVESTSNVYKGRGPVKPKHDILKPVIDIPKPEPKKLVSKMNERPVAELPSYKPEDLKLPKKFAEKVLELEFGIE